jgi:N-acetylmuramic acid 6-phosphate etherase
MTRITEQPSAHRHLEKKSIEEITAAINNEDKIVANAIEKALPQLNQLIAAVVNKLKNGGRMFYLGAGSGGRLSVLDAIELPTTYGIPKGMVNVILAGGVDRLADALEQMEDDTTGWMACSARSKYFSERFCDRHHSQRHYTFCVKCFEGMQKK